MQAAVDPDLWRQETGSTAVQLALPAGSPLPLLKELAGDSTFEGLVVVGLMPSIFFNVGFEMYRRRSSGTLASLRHSRRFWRHPSESIEATLSVSLAGRLAVMNPEVAPLKLIERIWTGDPRWYTIKYKAIRRNRFAPRNFDFINPDAHMIRQRDAFKGRGRAATAAERDSLITELERTVETLRSHNASVVLVRLPVCGLMLELEETEYPRERYWDEMASRVTAPAIHFKTYPELNPPACHDGSHIDWRESGDFTRALARIVSSVTD
jgi:hypothetical protein